MVRAGRRSADLEFVPNHRARDSSESPTIRMMKEKVSRREAYDMAGGAQHKAGMAGDPMSDAHQASLQETGHPPRVEVFVAPPWRFADWSFAVLAALGGIATAFAVFMLASTKITPGSLRYPSESAPRVGVESREPVRALAAPRATTQAEAPAATREKAPSKSRVTTSVPRSRLGAAEQEAREVEEAGDGPVRGRTEASRSERRRARKSSAARTEASAKKP
jgi:hypothetical protein